jgi:hypothetical protein
MLVAFVGGLWLLDILTEMTPHLQYHWLESVYYGQTRGTERGKLV